MPPPRSYSVIYNANGATAGVVPAPQTKTHGIDLILANNTGGLVKTGFVFAGWNTAATGTGTNFSVGATYTLNVPVILYAKWIPVPYPVIYNANGATAGVVPAPQNKTHGTNLVLANNTGGLAKTGYVFAGWNTSATGTGTNFSVGAMYTLNVPVILYAKWILVPPINGTCGTAAKTYVLAETGYGTSTFCTTGIRTSIPSFPTPGSTVNWECRGTNGGTNSACVATRISCPPVLPGCTDPATLPRDVNGCMIQTESDFNC
jgi:uncharacterized repeat protein (TIGR02543 family)